MTTFRCFLWIQERPCSAVGASHQAAVRTLAIAIGYCLRVNHLSWHYITDGAKYCVRRAS